MKYITVLFIVNSLILTSCSNYNKKLQNEITNNNEVIVDNKLQYAKKNTKKPVDSNIQIIKNIQSENNHKRKIENDFIKARKQEFEENANKFPMTKEMREEYYKKYGHNYGNYNTNPIINNNTSDKQKTIWNNDNTNQTTWNSNNNSCSFKMTWND